MDTLLAVYTGASVAGLKWVAANDDDETGAGGSTSRALFKAVAGIEYPIAVDAFGGEAGNITLTLVAAESAGPPIVVEASGKNILLAWPAELGDYLLESTESMSASLWTPVNQTPLVSDSKRLLKVGAGGSQRFFRLRKP